MAHLIAAASTYSFAPDRRRSWWARLIQSLARLGRAYAAERRRRRTIRALGNHPPPRPGFGPLPYAAGVG
jgi:hypothetical protein